MESLPFSLFSKPIQDKFNELSQFPEELFIVELSSFEIWEEYLNSYPEEVNGIFRERRHYDCNCCKNFIKRVGSIVRIKDNVIIDTIWNISTQGYYQEVTGKLHNIILNSKPIQKFVISESIAGSLPNIDNYNENIIWEHFYVQIPEKFIKSSYSINSFLSDIRTTVSLFKRALTELTLESAEIVLDLIDNNQIYRGQEYKHLVQFFIESKKEYDSLPENKKYNYILTKGSDTTKVQKLRLKNTAIGTLLTDLSEGMELDQAVRSFENKVDSTNYRRTTAVVSPQMIKKAKEAIYTLGYETALHRKAMSISELPSEEIIWKNNTSKALNVFDDISLEQEQRIVQEKTKNHKGRPLSINQLFDEVLPKAKECSILFDSKLKNHLMTLTNSIDPSAKYMFKWNNDVAWSYNGDVTDRIKERVKEVGGDVEGDLRVSLSWSNSDDLDLHCFSTVDNKEISYANKKNIPGMYLDLDMNGLDKSDPDHPVENIIVKNKSQLKPGRYIFIVNQFSCRNKTRYGFTIQVEFDGVIHSFSYEKSMKSGENFRCFEINYDGNNFEIIDINENFTSTMDLSKTEIWGLKTNTFVPVSTILLSPNYWADNKVGNKHYMFLIENAYNPEKVRTFYSEYLNEELTTHRKTIELLGANDSLKTEPSQDQLSGFGFSETSQSAIILRVVDNRNITTIYELSI